MKFYKLAIITAWCFFSFIGNVFASSCTMYSMGVLNFYTDSSNWESISIHDENWLEIINTSWDIVDYLNSNVAWYTWSYSWEILKATWENLDPTTWTFYDINWASDVMQWSCTESEQQTPISEEDLQNIAIFELSVTLIIYLFLWLVFIVKTSFK